jgi:cystathionine beta-lyase
VAARTITLTAPSKTYNIPGLACGYAIVQQPELFKRVQHTAMSTAGHVSVLGYTAAAAAYREGADWLAAALAYLTSNRDFVADYVAEFFPNVPVTRPEGTYLAWLDWRAFDLPGGTYRFFLEQARVALQDGAAFGEAGRGFMRLNFGASRAVLNEALDRMRSALSLI